MSTVSFVLSVKESVDMIIVVMGVCGSGKTTLGCQLAEKIGCSFADADQFHSDENKDKMTKGQPLTDQDRFPWLVSIYQYMLSLHKKAQSAVVTCSALKRSYRDILRFGSPANNLTELTETDEGESAERVKSTSGLRANNVKPYSKKHNQADGSLQFPNEDAKGMSNQCIDKGDKLHYSGSNQHHDSSTCNDVMKPLFVHLSGSMDLLKDRLSIRQGHFMPKTLLQSQLDTLEILGDDEDGFSVDIDKPLDDLINEIVLRLEDRNMKLNKW